LALGAVGVVRVVVVVVLERVENAVCGAVESLTE
jgi:hypothetical protein